MDTQEIEAEVQAMEWEHVSLEPELGWQDIEQELPQEWTQPLEPDLRDEYTQEEIAELADADLELPEGDIDTNAELALQELEDVDLEAIAGERDTLDIDLPEQEHDLDFGR